MSGVPVFNSIPEFLAKQRDRTLESLYFAVPDLHGRFEVFEEFVRQAEEAGVPNVIFLGDYIDRLPSHKLMDALLEVHARQPEWIFLPGNHEWMCLEWYLENELKIKRGAVKKLDVPRSTLMSEWVEKGDVPKEHIRFFDKILRKRYHLSERGQLLFVHAGVERSLKFSSLERMNPEHFLWSRRLPEAYTGPLLIHGHTFAGDSPGVTAHEVNLETRCWSGQGRPLSVGVFVDEGPNKFVALIEVRPSLVPILS